MPSVEEKASLEVEQKEKEPALACQIGRLQEYYSISAVKSRQRLKEPSAIKSALSH